MLWICSCSTSFEDTKIMIHNAHCTLQNGLGENCHCLGITAIAAMSVQAGLHLEKLQNVHCTGETYLRSELS